MEKKTIGTFIAALRKSSGMTQQELADKLNVSNKAVSRWERDECAPDISLIPALAEIFNVTCDELLKGERIFTDIKHGKCEPKVEKQLKALINRAISTFKTMMWISLALSLVGLVCMFGISYGFYRPVIGFAVMLLFEVSAFVLAVIGLNETRDIKTNNELFESADETLCARFNKTLGSYSFAAFFVIAATILSGIPLVVFSSDYYVDSVLTLKSYLSVFFSGIALVLVFVFVTFKPYYLEWISTNRFTQKIKDDAYGNVKRMNRIQIILIVSASALFLLCPYLLNPGNYTMYYISICVPVGACLANILVGIIFLVRYKDERKMLLLPCIRNILLVVPALLFDVVHGVSWTSTDGGVHFDRYDIWNFDTMLAILWIALIICLIFRIVEKVKCK